MSNPEQKGENEISNPWTIATSFNICNILICMNIGGLTLILLHLDLSLIFFFFFHFVNGIVYSICANTIYSMYGLYLGENLGLTGIHDAV